MFKEYLKKDLQAIFETESVDFANSLGHFGSELGCILVVVDQDGVKNNFREGENYFAVTGTIEYLQDQTQTKFGFFSQRMAMTQYKPKGTFRLIERESNETLAGDGNNDANRLVVKKSQKFSYRVSIPYNAPLGKIESVEMELTND